MQKIMALLIMATLISGTITGNVYAYSSNVAPLCMGEASECLGETIYAGSGTHKYGLLLQETCTRSLARSHHKDYCWTCGQIYNTYAGPHDCFMMHTSCGMEREDLCFAKGGLPGPGVQY